MRQPSPPAPANTDTPANVLDQSKQIADLLDELRLAQHELASGPEILMIVNELALCCEALFEDREALIQNPDSPAAREIRDMHEDFLLSFARFADQIRATNGEIDDAFFDFLAHGPVSALRLAA